MATRRKKSMKSRRRRSSRSQLVAILHPRLAVAKGRVATRDPRATEINQALRSAQAKLVRTFASDHSGLRFRSGPQPISARLPPLASYFDVRVPKAREARLLDHLLKCDGVLGVYVQPADDAELEQVTAAPPAPAALRRPARLARSAPSLAAGVLPARTLAAPAAARAVAAAPVVPPHPFTWDSDFLQRSAANRNRYAIGANSVIIDRATNRPASGISGFPFLDIDRRNAAVAGAQIVWNAWYLRARASQTKSPLTIKLITPPASELTSRPCEHRAYYFEGRASGTFPPAAGFYSELLDDKQARVLTERGWGGFDDVLTGRIDGVVRPLGAAFRPHRVRHLDIALDDLSVWSGNIPECGWSLVGTSTLDVFVSSVKGTLTRGSGGEWETGNPPSAPSLVDPWANGAGTTHLKVPRTVYEVAGRPIESWYDYVSHRLFVDVDTMFIYARELRKSPNEILRTIQADFAPAWSEDRSYSVPMSSVLKAADNETRQWTFVLAGNGKKPYHFNCSHLEPHMFTPSNV